MLVTLVNVTGRDIGIDVGIGIFSIKGIGIGIDIFLGTGILLDRNTFFSPIPIKFFLNFERQIFC